MRDKSIRCHQANGGSCRNKVSPANNFICAAGHQGQRENGSVFMPPKNTTIANLIDMNVWQKTRLAENFDTSSEFFDKLTEDEDWEVRAAVAGNPFASVGNLNTLSKDEVARIRAAVAGNSSTERETYISLAQEDYVPYGFTRGKPIGELIKDINLVDQYPDTFGLAYLNRLLRNLPQGDETHPKRRALIGYVYGKYAESDKSNFWDIGRYKDQIKELFPDDQEMAELIDSKLSQG